MNKLQNYLKQCEDYYKLLDRLKVLDHFSVKILYNLYLKINDIKKYLGIIKETPKISLNERLRLNKEAIKDE
jgi:hypothetical protein